MLQWKPSQLMGRYQMETGKRLTLAELAEASGVARSSVTTALAGQAKRVEELDPSLTVADLLAYVPGQRCS